MEDSLHEVRELRNARIVAERLKQHQLLRHDVREHEPNLRIGHVGVHRLVEYAGTLQGAGADRAAHPS